LKQIDELVTPEILRFIFTGVLFNLIKQYILRQSALSFILNYADLLKIYCSASAVELEVI